MLLAVAMAALTGMIQLGSAAATLTIVATTGLERIAGLGPAVLVSMGALAALPAGRAMDRFGRVPVLAAGFSGGMLGTVAVGLGALFRSGALVLGGLVVVGLSFGVAMLARVAAADLYPESERARGIGRVLAGSLLGAIAGPLVFMPLLAGRPIQADAFVMPWFAAAGFMLIGLIAVVCVRFDPPRAERTRGEGPPTSTFHSGMLGALGRRPVRAAIAALVSSYAAMAGLMGLMGFSLVRQGQDSAAIFPILTLHYLGMFGPFLIAGRLTDRVGTRPVMIGGISLLALSALVFALAPTAHGPAPALFGIGLGWSLTYLAGTAEIAAHTPPDQRGTVFGASDLASGLAGAALAVAGGAVLAAYGSLGPVLIGTGSAILALIGLGALALQAPRC